MTALTLILYFIRHLRNNEDLERVPSVRASIGLYERAQSHCLLNKRKNVTLKDVEEAMYSVIAHRIRLKPSIKYLMQPEEFLRKELKDFLGREENKENHPRHQARD